MFASTSSSSFPLRNSTPWRVILLGETAGDLTVNTVALNLAARCRLADTRWIKPGNGLWDWRIHGYNNASLSMALIPRPVKILSRTPSSALGMSYGRPL